MQSTLACDLAMGQTGSSWVGESSPGLINRSCGGLHCALCLLSMLNQLARRSESIVVQRCICLQSLNSFVLSLINALCLRSVTGGRMTSQIEAGIKSNV